MAREGLILSEAATAAAAGFVQVVDGHVIAKLLADKLFGVDLGGTGIRHDGDNTQLPPDRSHAGGDVRQEKPKVPMR
ncbi:MAG: hypothetical protein SFW64_08040 [Alphaproteobacteria bacterium]|nr:hypothetical protein [Alphaproteobacteria bacterium]